jgi:proteasome lid subunit RPN8/RPN11
MHLSGRSPVLTLTAGAWNVVLEHARAEYPRECCGVLLGQLDPVDDNLRTATVAIPCRNAYDGDQRDRFFIDPGDQLAAQKRARAEDLEVLGFFHSHPDDEAYFSATDLANSWPWYSNVVVSVRNGEVAGAACFRANEERTGSEAEQLNLPE